MYPRRASLHPTLRSLNEVAAAAQCGRPFDPRLAYPGSFRTSNGMKVPEALDIISIDM